MKSIAARTVVFYVGVDRRWHPPLRGCQVEDGAPIYDMSLSDGCEVGMAQMAILGTTGESMSWMDVNGVSLNYRLQGRPDNPLVVMLHEIGGTLESFNDVVPFLEADRNVLTFDQRGAGQSEKLVGHFDIEDLVDDTLALVDELCGEVPFDIVTVAAAGLQALRIYEKYPDRLRSMVLCNPALGVDSVRSAALRDRADFVERNGIRAGLDMTLEKSYPVELRDTKVFPDFRGRYLSNDVHCFAEANRVLAHTDLRHLIPTLKCPVLVAAGRFDQVRPSQGSQEIARQISGSDFELLDGGHFLPTTAPVALGEVLARFYRMQDSTSKS